MLANCKLTFNVPPTIFFNNKKDADPKKLLNHFTRIGNWNKNAKNNDLSDRKDYFYLFKFYININLDEIDKLQNLNFRIAPCFLYIT